MGAGEGCVVPRSVREASSSGSVAAVVSCKLAVIASAESAVHGRLATGGQVEMHHREM